MAIGYSISNKILFFSAFAAYMPLLVQAKLQAPADWDRRVKEHVAKYLKTSELECKTRFIDILKGWELFGSSFFIMRASNDPRFASGGLLCVDGVGIKVLDRTTRVSLGNLFFFLSNL